MTIEAYAADEPGGKLKLFEYEPGTLGREDVEIDVEYCGICHSDLSMLDNEWGTTQYPFPSIELMKRSKNYAMGNLGIVWYSSIKFNVSNWTI
jgi:uncharacterized zinc-type alcohol dehydrogenase-like protein